LQVAGWEHPGRAMLESLPPSHCKLQLLRLMNSQLKKLLLLVLAVALLAAGGVTQRAMNRDRAALGLTRIEPLENAPPVLAFTTVALGGFRGLIANALWIRANELQEQDKFFEMSQLADWITKLEPHFVQVWVVQAWNMAYNISVKFKENGPGDYTDRWRWVQRGVELLRDEGLKYNPNEMLMYRELAWFFQHKIGANLDDGHMFYKQQWVIETSKVFGSTNQVSLESLLHPTDDDTRQRAALLREKFKMDPQTVLDVNEQYGPLDWRMPETYAIYWAHVGMQRAKTHPDRIKKEDVMTLRRVTYQCMHLAFQRGRLIPNYFTRTFEYGPNLDLIPKVNAAYLEQMAEQPDMATHIGTSHRNFLRDAVYFLYIHNREAEAAKWFKVIADKYPDKPLIDGQPDSLPRNVSLDEVCFAKLQEAIGETSQIGMKNILEGLITQSYLSLVVDEDERAAGFMNLARKAHERYQSKVTARKGAIDMPPFNEIQRDVLKRMLDPENGLADEMAARLATKLGVPLPPRVAPKTPAPAAPASTNAPTAQP
jgi:hypothetical protein